MPMPSSPLKVAGTAVLTISLLSLQGALWYFRPQPTGNVPPPDRCSVVNIHGGNRRLLDFNSSLESDQQLSSDNLRQYADGRTNDHPKSVSCTLYFSLKWILYNSQQLIYYLCRKLIFACTDSHVLYRCSFERSNNLFIVYLSSFKCL